MEEEEGEEEREEERDSNVSLCSLHHLCTSSFPITLSNFLLKTSFMSCLLASAHAANVVTFVVDLADLAPIDLQRERRKLKSLPESKREEKET